MSDKLSHGAVIHVGVSLVFGWIITVMIYAFGHISGAHFNPAVTLALQHSTSYGKLVESLDAQHLKSMDLGERLGLSFSGPKSRVQRAREKLKQELQACCHFELDRRGHILDYQPRCDC